MVYERKFTWCNYHPTQTHLPSIFSINFDEINNDGIKGISTVLLTNHKLYWGPKYFPVNYLLSISTTHYLYDYAVTYAWEAKLIKSKLKTKF